MAKFQLEINIDKSCFHINCENSGRHLQSEIIKQIQIDCILNVCTMHFIMCLDFSKVLQETEIYQLLNFNVIFYVVNIKIPAMQI